MFNGTKFDEHGELHLPGYSATVLPNQTIQVWDTGDPIFLLPAGFPADYILPVCAAYEQGLAAGKRAGRAVLQHELRKALGAAMDK